MPPSLVVVVVISVLLLAYLTYGRWLSRRIFDTEGPGAADQPTPAHTLKDDADFVPTKRSVLFGHHFTSIAGTGPIVGPAIAVMWGWLPAILWVVFGSIFIGAVHDLGSLVISLRNKGRSIGDVAGDLLGPRVRLIFLCILIVGLWIVLAIFGLVIAGVQRTYPTSIAPVLLQIPIAIAIGLFIHRGGRSIFIPSAIALTLMYASVIWGDVGVLHDVNMFLAAQPIWIWTAALLIYCYFASVLPVWILLQPRDYINALQLVSCLALITVGLITAATLGGAPDAPFRDVRPYNLTGGANEPSAGEVIVTPSENARLEMTRESLAFVAPMIDWQPTGAPPMFPLLFITIACGAVSGFHCLIASGTSSKQVNVERDARLIAYGSMLTEGFLATLVIAACAAGIGLGIHRCWNIRDAKAFQTMSDGSGTYALLRTRSLSFVTCGANIEIISDLTADRHLGKLIVRPSIHLWSNDKNVIRKFAEELRRESRASDPIVRDFTRNSMHGALVAVHDNLGNFVVPTPAGTVTFGFSDDVLIRGKVAYAASYRSDSSVPHLADATGSFVEGSANFLHALGIPLKIGIALMAVMVVSFAATTLDTACRLQRYVIQEFASTFLPKRKGASCPSCGYDLSKTPPNTDSTYTCPECGRSSSQSAVMMPTRVHRQDAASSANPFKWLGMAPVATLIAVVPAFLLLIIPANLTWPTSPTGGSATFTAGLQQLLGNIGSNGTGMWLLFGTVSHLLAGLGFIVIAAWLIAKRKPIWFLMPPAVLTLGFSAWAIIWRAFVGTPEIPSWFTLGNWTLIAISVLALALEAWVIGEFVWRRKRI